MRETKGKKGELDRHSQPVAPVVSQMELIAATQWQRELCIGEHMDGKESDRREDRSLRSTTHSWGTIGRRKWGEPERERDELGWEGETEEVRETMIEQVPVRQWQKGNRAETQWGLVRCRCTWLRLCSLFTVEGCAHRCVFVSVHLVLHGLLVFRHHYLVFIQPDVRLRSNPSCALQKISISRRNFISYSVLKSIFLIK